MKLNDFLKYIEHSAVTGVNLGANNTTGLTPNNHEELIYLINDTVDRLKTEFPSDDHEEVYIELRDEINFYHLDREYAQTNTESTQPIKYIADSVEQPFVRPVLKVINAYNEVGVPLSINDSNDEDGIFLADYNTIQVLKPVTGNTICIIYQAGRISLDPDAENYLDQFVDIPPVFKYLAKLDVIRHVLMNRKTQSSENEANKYDALYERELNRLIDKGYGQNDGTQTNKLGDRGWP